MEPDHHALPGRAVADGVVDQDADQLPEACRVADQLDGLDLELEPWRRVAAATRVHALDGFEGELGELDRHALDLGRARIGPREQQQLVDQVGQAGHPGVDVLDRPADVRDLRLRVTTKVLQAGPDDRQRRPKLVARVGRKRRWRRSDSRIGTRARPDMT